MRIWDATSPLSASTKRLRISDGTHCDERNAIGMRLSEASKLLRYGKFRLVVNHWQVYQLHCSEFEEFGVEAIASFE